MALTVSALGLLCGVVGVVAVVRAVGGLARVDQEVADQPLQHDNPHRKFEQEELDESEDVGGVGVHHLVCRGREGVSERKTGVILEAQHITYINSPSE